MPPADSDVRRAAGLGGSARRCSACPVLAGGSPSTRAGRGRPGRRHSTLVLSFAEAHGATKATRDDIALAVSEACANVVMHAYVNAAAPGSLTVEASHLNGELVVAVRDEGRGMQPRPDSPGLGLGLSIIGRLAQPDRRERRVRYRSANDLRRGRRECGTTVPP